MADSPKKWQFSEEEIRAKLQELGYSNIPEEALKEFSSDLHKLISSKNPKVICHGTTSTSSTPTISATSRINEPIYADDDEQKTLAYTTSTSSSPSDGESSFEQYLITQNHRPNTYAALAKENQAQRQIPTSKRAMQKRKVLRKKNGEAVVFDESFNQENATDISEMEKRLQKLPLKDDLTNDDDMSERSSVLQPWGTNRNALPSFIRPRTADAYSKGIRKTDPVTRYHKFKQEWSSNKVPGEKTHKSLRWSTRITWSKQPSHSAFAYSFLASCINICFNVSSCRSPVSNLDIPTSQTITSHRRKRKDKHCDGNSTVTDNSSSMVGNIRERGQEPGFYMS